MNTSASTSEVPEFGKDLGVVHEAVITGRKLGAGRTFWSRLAHNEMLFQKVLKSVTQMVVAARPFDPVSFIGNGWSLIAEERDERSAALPEIDFSQVVFETSLEKGESSIRGEEKLKRLKAGGKIRCGYTVFMGLWEEYKARKEDSVLERLHKEQDITYMDFFGDVLLVPIVPSGHRNVLCLDRYGGAWRWGCRWLGGEWGAAGRSASLAS